MGAKLASLSGVLGATQDRGLAYITSTTFSAASTVSVDGCFTGSYDNYFLSLNFAATAADDTFLRLRVAGVDTSANYNFQSTQANAASYLAGRQTAATGMNTGYATSTRKNTQRIFVTFPATAEPTLFETSGYSSLSEALYKSLVGNQTSSTAFDGFTFYNATGTITGSIYVYGYRKA